MLNTSTTISVAQRHAVERAFEDGIQSQIAECLLAAVSPDDDPCRAEMMHLSVLWLALETDSDLWSTGRDPRLALEKLVAREERAEHSGGKVGLIGVMAEHGLGLEILEARLDAVARRLEPSSIRDDRDLVRYAYGMGSGLGILLARVAGIRSPGAVHCIVDAGIGFEVLRVAREALGGHMSGACLLPVERRERHALAWSDVGRGAENSAPFGYLCAEVVDLGLRYLESADQGLAALPLSARANLHVSLTRARHEGEALLSDAFTLPGMPRTRDGLNLGVFQRGLALARLALPRYWPRNEVAHQRALHVALRGLPGASIHG